jgi:hypothetical protein
VKILKGHLPTDKTSLLTHNLISDEKDVVMCSLGIVNPNKTVTAEPKIFIMNASDLSTKKVLTLDFFKCKLNNFSLAMDKDYLVAFFTDLDSLNRETLSYVFAVWSKKNNYSLIQVRLK